MSLYHIIKNLYECLRNREGGRFPSRIRKRRNYTRPESLSENFSSYTFFITTQIPTQGSNPVSSLQKKKRELRRRNHLRSIQYSCKFVGYLPEVVPFGIRRTVVGCSWTVSKINSMGLFTKRDGVSSEVYWSRPRLQNWRWSTFRDSV